MNKKIKITLITVAILVAIYFAYKYNTYAQLSEGRKKAEPFLTWISRNPFTDNNL